MTNFFVIKKKGENRYLHTAISKYGPNRTALSIANSITWDEADKYTSIDSALINLKYYLGNQKTFGKEDFDIMEMAIHPVIVSVHDPREYNY